MKKSIIFSAITALVLSSSFGVAKDSSFRESVRQRSASGGNPSSLRGLERIAGPGRDARLAEVLERLDTSVPDHAGKAVREIVTGEDSTFVKGEGYTLDVRGDGNWVRYAQLDRSHGGRAAPQDVSDRFSDRILEKLGRKFIGEALPEVALGEGETFELWRTSHEIEIDAEIGGEEKRKVVASRVVLTRAVDGVPVIGPGSKVTVDFATDQAVIGFAYDWSTFKSTGQSKRQAKLEKVHKRRNVVAGQHKLSPNQTIELDQFECGFYDVGARLGSSGQEVIGACVAGHRVVDGVTSSMVILDAVPTAETLPSNDLAWPEVAVLRSAKSD